MKKKQKQEAQPLGPRDRVKRRLQIGGGIAAVLLVTGIGSCSANLLDARQAAERATQGADAAPDAKYAQETAGCQETARRWVTTLTDKELAPQVWAKKMTQDTHPDLVQSLSGVDRKALPDGPVADVKAVADAESCDARVTVQGGAGLALTLEPVNDAGAWRVTGWVAT